MRHSSVRSVGCWSSSRAAVLPAVVTLGFTRSAYPIYSVGRGTDRVSTAQREIHGARAWTASDNRSLTARLRKQSGMHLPRIRSSARSPADESIGDEGLRRSVDRFAGLAPKLFGGEISRASCAPLLRDEARVEKPPEVLTCGRWRDISLGSVRRA